MLWGYNMQRWKDCSPSWLKVQIFQVTLSALPSQSCWSCHHNLCYFNKQQSLVHIRQVFSLCTPILFYGEVFPLPLQCDPVSEPTDLRPTSDCLVTQALDKKIIGQHLWDKSFPSHLNRSGREEITWQEICLDEWVPWGRFVDTFLKD